MTGRVVEILTPDHDGVILSVRPPLPFLPDGVRLHPDRIELYQADKRLYIPAQPDQISAVRFAEGLLLIEHHTEAGVPPREVDLLVTD